MTRCIALIILSVISINVKADKPLNVFVSILPQQYFVEKVGGEHTVVSVMVGPGQSPATYEPTPRQMANLANADIYFSMGVPFESAWLERVKNNNKSLLVVDCCHSMADLEFSDHAHSHDHHHGRHDPHIWTSPIKVIEFVKLVSTSLSTIDALNKTTYQASAENFIKELMKLDHDIQQKLKDINNKQMIVSHPSWGYFADRYGFKQISI